MLDKRSDSLERILVTCAFAIYLIVQLHAAAFHGSWGQDWLGHKMWTSIAAQHPWHFFTTYEIGRTNPALYHLVGGAVLRIVGLSHYLAAIGVVNIVFGFIGNCFLYFAARRLIASRWLRIAAIVLVLFLPAAMIHAQVMAADALATPLYWAILWLAIRFPSLGSTKSFSVSTAAMALLLVAGLFLKFTFLSCVAAAAIWMVGLCWTKQLSLRRLAVLIVSVALVPGLLGYFEMKRFTSGTGNVWGVTPITLERLSKGEMNLGSVLGLRPADVEIFDAPPYNHFAHGTYDLLRDNKHSFVALLHLGAFTDLMNVYQPDPYDYYYGSRTLRSQRRMQLAVRTGLIATLLAILAVGVLFLRSVPGTIFKRDPRHFAIFTVLLFSLGWFCNLIVLLPFIPGAYVSGYWLPRLYVPALQGFFLLVFVFLEWLPWRRPSLQVGVLLGVLAQSVLHVTFLWPVPSDRKLYEYNADIENIRSGAVWRAFTWQDNYGYNLTGSYWVDRTMGIVVNRPHLVPPETWKMKLVLSRGPTPPSGRRVVRISAPNAAPTVVEFSVPQGVASVNMDLTLNEGRNDIRLDVLEPKDGGETFENPSAQVVYVSQISFQRADGVRATLSRQ